MKRWMPPFVLGLLSLLAWPASPSSRAASDRPTGKLVPRTVLALYDGRYDQEIHLSPIHQIVEMPLNHLGLIVRYWDINNGLPKTAEMEDVRGVLTFFRDNRMADPVGYLNWASDAIDSGKKFAIIGEISADRNLKGNLTPLATINRFLAKLGLRSENEWTQLTYDVEIVYKVPSMVEFERPLTGVLPAFAVMRRIDSRAKSYLVAGRRGRPETYDLVVVGPTGGYIAGRYALHYTGDSDHRQWYVNPFEFFRLAFTTDEVPKPDTTTLGGRRIFYSHVDGDGWRNVTEIPRYRRTRMLAAEVILKDVIRAFPDIPVTVAPIAADLDPAWSGTEETLRVAREIFQLPNVQAGSHTYSHPLDWGYLANELKESAHSPALISQNFLRVSSGWLHSLTKVLLPEESVAQDSAAPGSQRRYSRPRSYELLPFSIDLEVPGSIAFINTLLPKGKRVEAMQWSGDTRPFEQAVRSARTSGVRNINGGDSKFDPERLSYAWVAPLSRQVGHERQIYASNSNENSYTDLWTDRFFGFKYLVATVQNTESPIRVKPLNIYYHMYSGEKLPSFNALMENLQYVRSQEVVPITLSNFAGIVDGFHSARIVRLDTDCWRVEDRDELSTIRFDNSGQKTIDFSRSQGVLGARHYQGSLYVALDPAAATPIVALISPAASSGKPYLVESHWKVSSLERDRSSFSFRASGFGAGAMSWRVPSPGRYVVEAHSDGNGRWAGEFSVGKDGLLRFAVELDGVNGVSVRVTP